MSSADNEFYSPEAVNELAAEMFALQEQAKYLLSCRTPKDEDTKYMTKELLAAFTSTLGTAQDLVSSLEYYLSKYREEFPAN